MSEKQRKHEAPPRYDEAFKAGAVRMVTEQGRPSREVASELGVCIDTLRSWLKTAGAPSPGGRGESSFTKELLSSLIAESEAKCAELQKHLEDAKTAYDEGQTILDSLNAQYDDIISWADMYDSASFEARKMIVNCLIGRVEVFRGYKLHIDFKIDFEQFSLGIDIPAVAA